MKAVFCNHFLQVKFVTCWLVLLCSKVMSHTLWLMLHTLISFLWQLLYAYSFIIPGEHKSIEALLVENSTNKLCLKKFKQMKIKKNTFASARIIVNFDAPHYAIDEYAILFYAPVLLILYTNWILFKICSLWKAQWRKFGKEKEERTWRDNVEKKSGDSHDWRRL